MFPVLLLSLIAVEPAATVAVAQDDAPVRISINNDRRFVRGDRAKVKVRVENDGFLLVVQADAEGRVRVLFPLDPSDDNFVRGDRSYEIRGRGDRESFTVDENSGEGAVYAALSRDPFRFGDYAINGHWDFNALNVRELPEDPEPELTELVRRMSNGRFDYDYLTYSVFDYGDVAYSPTVIHRTTYVDPFCGSSYYFRYDCDPYYYGSRYSLQIHLGNGFDYYDPYRFRYGYYYPYRYAGYYSPYRYAGYYYPRPYPYGYGYYPRGGFPYRDRLVTPSGFKQRDRLWDGDNYRDRVAGGGVGNVRATHTVYGEPPVRRAVTTSDPGRSPITSPSTSRDLSDRPSRRKATSPELRRPSSADAKANVERAPVSRERVRTRPDAEARERDEDDQPTRARPSRSEERSRSAEPSRSVEPSRRTPSRAEPERGRAAPSRSEPSRAAPSRPEPSRAAPSRPEPSRAAPDRSEPSARSAPEPSRSAGSHGGDGGGGRRTAR